MRPVCRASLVSQSVFSCSCFVFVERTVRSSAKSWSWSWFTQGHLDASFGYGRFPHNPINGSQKKDGGENAALVYSRFYWE